MTQTMTNEEAKEYLKTQIADYLKDSMGIDNVDQPFHCVNPEHIDNNPSMSLHKQGNFVKCFACDATYDIFNLVEINEDIHGFYNQLKHLCDIYDIEISDKKYSKQRTQNKQSKQHTHDTQNTQGTPAGVQKEDYTNYLQECCKNITKTSYLSNRGISIAIQKKYNIGYDANYNWAWNRETKQWETKEVIIIPNDKYSYVARNISPEATGKDRYRKKGRNKIYNCRKNLFNDNEPIFIVEGEIDALSIIEVGGKAIALGSVANVEQLAKTIVNNVPADKCPPLIMCLDCDTSGQEAQLKADNKFKSAGYFTIGAMKKENHIFKGCKDANELLMKSREELQEQVNYYKKLASEKAEEERRQELEAYVNDVSARGSLDEFVNGIKNGASTVYIPTGYAELDNALEGGITEGLYILGAISSLGKTTFVLQMGDQIAKSGRDVLIFSLEMAKAELMAKSISRNTYLLGNCDIAKTTRGITTTARYKLYTEAETELIQKATQEYSSYAENIFIHEGCGDIGYKEIRKAVERHIKLRKKTPVIIIDYLQLIAPHNERATDKQNTDKAILELKRLSRDLKLPVVGISSFNRQSYAGEVNMSSFKESGAIEYGSDVLIGLQLARGRDGKVDESEAKAVSNDVKVPREIELKILKNRNGKTGIVLKYSFYSAFNYFAEEKDLWSSPITPMLTTMADVPTNEIEEDFDWGDIEM